MNASQHPGTVRAAGHDPQEAACGRVILLDLDPGEIPIGQKTTRFRPTHMIDRIDYLMRQQATSRTDQQVSHVHCEQRNSRVNRQSIHNAREISEIRGETVFGPSFTREVIPTPVPVESTSE